MKRRRKKLDQRLQKLKLAFGQVKR